MAIGRDCGQGRAPGQRPVRRNGLPQGPWMSSREARPARSHRRAAPGARPPQAGGLAHLARAEALAADGSLAQAAHQVDAVLAERPDLAQAWHLKGVLALMQGRAEAAAEALARAAALTPEDAVCRVNLGIAQHQAGRLDDAEASLRRAL